MLIRVVTIGIFCVAFSITSYLATRGVDGELFLLFGLWTLITLIYMSVVICQPKVMYKEVFTSCWLFGLGACIAMMFDSHLDEMAGMLYIIIPALMICTLCLSLTTLFFKNRIKQSNQHDDQTKAM